VGDDDGGGEDVNEVDAGDVGWTKRHSRRV
jgi:hypothetical protein